MSLRGVQICFRSWVTSVNNYSHLCVLTMSHRKDKSDHICKCGERLPYVKKQQ